MDKKKQITIGHLYDFDHTLSPVFMQDGTIIPKLKMTANTFWSQKNAFGKKHNMDFTLSYMKFLADMANKQGVDISPDALRKMGKEIELFIGLDTWFDRVNEYGESKGAVSEFYVASTGLKHMIEGTIIGKHCKEIFACEYLYDENGKPIWPLHVVDHIQKQGCVSRVSKGCLDLTDDAAMNQYMPDEDRPIPYPNIIGYEDGFSGIPMLAMLKREGGYAVGVYSPYTKDTKTCEELLAARRIDCFAPADYSKGSEIERKVFDRIDYIVEKANEKA